MYTYYEIETINCLSGIIVRKHKSQKKGALLNYLLLRKRGYAYYILYI